MPNYVFSIEGNVGSGKSYLIKNLMNSLKTIYLYDIVYLPEPVNEWEKIKNKEHQNIIQVYYKDPVKYGFSFQIMTLISRITQLRTAFKNYKNTIFIIERSVYADRNVFCQMLTDDGIIDKINYNIYVRWFDEFKSEIPVTGNIYINTDVFKTIKRIEQRARKGENSITKEYLTKLKEYHDKWLYNGETPLLELDGNIDYKKIIPPAWFSKIMTFIHSKVVPKIKVKPEVDWENVKEVYC
jgi:deoxyadenosine/deoxycytidine kinase